MTPRERVEAALRWEPVDWVPFTVYSTKLPTSAVERRLRNDGLCPVDRHVAFKGGAAGATNETYRYVEDGKLLERTVTTTPAGELTAVRQPMGFTTWTHEHMYKGPDDFEPLLWLIEHTQYTENLAPFEAHQARWEDDGFVRGNATNLPIQTLISSYLGTVGFGYAWMDHQDQVVALIEALHRTFIESCQTTAASSAVAVNLGGNHTPEIIGRQRFEQFVMEPWAEACSILQPAGKLVGSHLDDDNRLWVDLVAQSPLDYIEALTPSPDCDLSVAEAREVWPDKVLWINFPSSKHLSSHEEIAALTHQMIAESGDGRGFIIGITEDVPPDRWAENFTVILRECRAAGPRP